MFAANLFHKTKKSALICMNHSYCILKTRIQCDFECTFDDNKVLLLQVLHFLKSNKQIKEFRLHV